ncbi:MAG: 3',5'-cyclic-AMP phosphodiesterase [Pseudomonadota bacterium]
MLSHRPQCLTLPHDGGPVRVIQITDTHLCATHGGTLLGMDTDHSLQAVVDLVRHERSEIDLVLGTGDLSDQGAIEAYHRAHGYFSQLGEHYYWLPGNHDESTNMLAIEDTEARMCGEIRIANWQIIMLDSQLQGEVRGELGSTELARLQRVLESGAEQGLFALVCLHHHPIEIGCDWLDEQVVSDADAFFDILQQYPAVKAVLWGHVHQEVDRIRGGIRLLASPSTCVQFAPNSTRFKADSLAPGYRWLDLGADGDLQTGVSRVTGVHFNVDLDSQGYL